MMHEDRRRQLSMNRSRPNRVHPVSVLELKRRLMGKSGKEMSELIRTSRTQYAGFEKRQQKYYLSKTSIEKLEQLIDKTNAVA